MKRITINTLLIVLQQPKYIIILMKTENLENITKSLTKSHYETGMNSPSYAGTGTAM